VQLDAPQEASAPAVHPSASACFSEGHSELDSQRWSYRNRKASAGASRPVVLIFLAAWKTLKDECTVPA